MGTVLKTISIARVEERPKDAWFDLSLRSLVEGTIRFYRVRDAVTGQWLFKTCTDRERGRVIVKAVICPPGFTFAQLEGDSMVFARSLFEGYLYDVITFTYLGEDNRVRRRAPEAIDDIPAWVRENFVPKPYKEATGKEPTYGRNYVTLVREEDERSMLRLFLLERAWPISPIPSETRGRYVNILPVIRELETVRVENLYQVLNQRFQMSRAEVDSFLSSLERDGKVSFPEPGYVKSRR